MDSVRNVVLQQVEIIKVIKRKREKTRAHKWTKKRQRWRTTKWHILAASTPSRTPLNVPCALQQGVHPFFLPYPASSMPVQSNGHKLNTDGKWKEWERGIIQAEWAQQTHSSLNRARRRLRSSVKITVTHIYTWYGSLLSNLTTFEEQIFPFSRF